MKPRRKLILFLTSILTLGLLGMVLNKIQQNAGVPFPGAVIVLDDASWTSRRSLFDGDQRYLRTPTNTVLYAQSSVGRGQVVQRQISSDGTASPPEYLPVFLTDKQEITRLSPDGKILCLFDETGYPLFTHTFVRADGQGKPVVLKSPIRDWFWSPDSRHLYAIRDNQPPLILLRCDANTGTVTETTLKTGGYFHLTSVTQEGRLLGFLYSTPVVAGFPTLEWDLQEVKGNAVIVTTFQKRTTLPDASPYISPDGKRILYAMYQEEKTLWDKLLERIGKKKLTSRSVIRWQVMERDGSNERRIGVVPYKQQEEGDLDPRWTPDGKGVHFLQNGKLMYLSVP